MREALFISHANPEDNAFARWLGAKLAAMGYEVWADVMRLHGGSDWARELEAALRLRAVKMLLVGTRKAMDKQGVRNEIEIAAQLASELKDREFIIPLRLERYDAPFRIVQAQYVDFSGSWATGLAEVVDLIENVHRIPRREGRPMQDWLAAQTLGATRLIQQTERLASNWLLVNKLPNALHYCERSGAFPIEKFHDRELHHWPIVPFGPGVLTFAAPGRGVLAPNLPAQQVNAIEVSKFLDEGWEELGISAFDARNKFCDLANQALEKLLKARGLQSYQGSGRRFAWWGDIKTVPLTQIAFNWQRWSGRRQIIGLSNKRGVHWHYGVIGHFRTAPVRHVRLSARLIFSNNGLDALDDVKKMHRLRRSFARSWRNARWRDMMYAFLWWLSSGSSELLLQVSDSETLDLVLPPISFKSPVSVLHEGEAPRDEDDPDVDVDYWDEWFDDDEDKNHSETTADTNS